MKYQVLGVVVAVGLLGLCGCSGHDSQSTANTRHAGDSGAQDPEENSHPKATYGSVVELRDAFESAGGECPDFVQDNKVKLAAESARCSPSSVLSTYLSQSVVEEQVKQSKENFLGFADEEWLVGENWIINDQDARDLQGSMGGQIVTLTAGPSSGLDEGDQLFARVMATIGRKLSKEQLSEAYNLGQSYCKMLDKGVSPEDVMQAAATDDDTSFTKEERGIIFATGVVAFCSEYAANFE